MVDAVGFSKIQIQPDTWRCTHVVVETSDRRSWNLLFNFFVKFKIIILEHKFSQFNKALLKVIF